MGQNHGTLELGWQFPRYGREGMAQESEREVEKHMERDGDCGPYRYIIYI